MSNRSYTEQLQPLQTCSKHMHIGTNMNALMTQLDVGGEHHYTDEEEL